MPKVFYEKLCFYTKSTSDRRKNKLDYIKIKNISASKDTIKKVKKQPREWEKIFANYISDKGLVFRICNKFLQVNNKRQKTPQFLKWAIDLNRHFFKDIQMANEHMKGSLLAIFISTLGKRKSKQQ